MKLAKIKHFLSFILRNYCSWIPDKQYLRLLYWVETGKILNLIPPRTFQDKIQWLKLYNRNPKYTKLVDKVAVKDYVSNIIGERYIISTIKVWDNIDDVNLSDLPNQFVLKTASGGGSCGVIVCTNKENFDIEKAKQKLKKSLQSDIYKGYREWPYKNVPTRILAEEFLTNQNDADLPDYKFFCFNGEPLYCQVIRNRHTKETIDFYDKDWNHQEFVGLNPKAAKGETPIDKPLNYEEMLSICKILSEGIPFVRVDLYNIKGKVYFGEMTFYPGSGFGRFEPEIWNLKLGEKLKLKNKSYNSKTLDI